MARISSSSTRSSNTNRQSPLSNVYLLIIAAAVLATVYLSLSLSSTQSQNNETKSAMDVSDNTKSNAVGVDNLVSQQQLRKKNPVEVVSSGASVTASDVDRSKPSSGGRRVVFEVSNLSAQGDGKGTFVVQLHPDWAPLGVERFEELVEQQFFNGCRTFRVIQNFVAQFGINGDPATQASWKNKSIKDDPVKTTNARGTLSFATSGPDTRSTQIFINTGKGNAYLDSQGFSPFGEVVSGMELVDKLYSGYGESPKQWKIEKIGNEYLEEEFPRLSFLEKVYFQS